jgi:hypothetical protein
MFRKKNAPVGTAFKYYFFAESSVLIVFTPNSKYITWHTHRAAMMMQGTHIPFVPLDDIEFYKSGALKSVGV